jgi:hypothetical protein
MLRKLAQIVAFCVPAYDSACHWYAFFRQPVRLCHTELGLNPILFPTWFPDWRAYDLFWGTAHGLVALSVLYIVFLYSNKR